MFEAKETHLNGAYYGPPIPPQQSYSYRRRPVCCCVLSTFMKVLIAICVALGITVLVLWLVLRPNKMKFYVVTADLSEFNLTNGNTLNYNLSLNMAVRNPNKRIGIYYDRLEAVASYQGERFAWDNLPHFYQGHKNTTNIPVNFHGQPVVVLDGSDILTFDAEKSSGLFYIDVKIYSRIRFKIGSIKTRRIKPEIECELRIPLSSNATTLATRFESTKCDVNF
ncbi:PREDICTED: protein YLS9-like [Nelumbo nucifera]|uniref:Late embryogenesis abundant protein LEA-2 subgroup domain-containing protein n=2 Tax=Nelumbo nucifera TaxID=4432 RepID=A0A822ZU47_NELNU|nr:PREDICTED: protein YLS9-like [Nelumbo nucifera]DAD48397.1 TPA_asm: hypothetical protein HUJ06_018334 [Nelumbo nucifera]